MEDDNEYLKLPVEERCVHKAWKARVHGYEEAKKIFSQIPDEKSPEWNKFLGLLKKMVVDSNAVAQEKGLEAVLVYVENCAIAGKTVGDVMGGLVTKCVAAAKAKTKEFAAQISLMYIEIEKQEVVMEELLKGTEQKNPKIVSGCINIMTQAIREFGIKVVNIKPLVKRLPVLLEDRDKTVRDETKLMTVEMFRWIGAALNPQLSSLKPVQVTELEAEFEKVKGGKAVPTRYIRSEQAKQAKIASEVEEAGGDGDAEEGDEADAPDVDPYELMLPVDILSKLPKDWHEKVEAKKWQERKEALDSLEQQLQGGPKLENGDYADVVRALKKMVTKDSNVVVVTLAIKCLAGIANGLKKRFQPYSVACISSLLEKFKEKKTTVVAALREAVDACFISTTLEAIQEDVVAALDNKNPSVKAESAAFLARCFTKCTPVILNKKLLKTFSTVLLKTINEPDPNVRDASAEALGTAMKVVGEKGISPFLADVDNIKMAKIKEAHDKAELQVKQPKAVVKKAPAAVERPASAKPSAGSIAPKAVKRPSSTATKKPAAAVKKTVSSTSNGAKANKPVERELTPEEVDEKADEILPPDVISGLADSNWKTRMGAVEQFFQLLSTLDPSEVSSQLLFRLINKKPGLKDTNFQVAKLRLDTIKAVCENFPVTVTGLSAVVTDVTEKLSDSKTQAAAVDALTALSEATTLEQVATQILDYAFTQKNPKVQVEVFNWLSNAVQEFGFNVQPKLIMENVKKGVTAINPAVRSSAVSFVGVLSIYMGSQVNLYFESEKPALLQLITAECEKHAGKVAVSPVRSAKQESRRSSMDTVLSAAAEEEEAAPAFDPEPEDEPPKPAKKVDLSNFINDALINELSDKNWKVRAEAVQKIQNMITESGSITSNLGESPPALAARLVDSNTKIAVSALALCQSIASAMGPECAKHVRTFFPSFLQGMGDSKSWIRTAAIGCINAWGDQCGYREFFDGEMVADALKSGSPTLRSELWCWLAEKLPNLPAKSVSKEEMVACIPTLLANLEDRNADVRKNAADAVLGVMIHSGYSPLYSACDKLKPGSQGPVKIILEKARGCLPEKPVQKSKSASNIPGDKGKAPPKMGPGSTATFTKPKTKPGAAASVKPGGRKKDEDVDTSPLLQVNNYKNQRVIDEQKLKTLKWNFNTPREEFVELLKDQMSSAGVNKMLIANMFHADFKYHLRAIDSLNEDLTMGAEGQTANLDLILKWMTLRFFDTNPSVLLKGLEYLQTLFNILIDNQYNMLENEASSFLPYLILKIGDPKDAVRNNVRALLKQIWSVFPISKLSIYLMDGLKSKNARQRAECLEHMGVLMENFGLTVCQPTPAAALKEIAKQISDRDNSVRTAALNCIVTAYFIDGEKVLKMVGQISDKDMSLLEERIKRAAKNRPVASVKPLQQTMAPRPSVAPAPAPVPVYDEPESEEDEEPLPVIPQIQRPKPVSGPFGLDQSLLEKIDSQTVNCFKPKLREFDLHFLKEPSTMVNPPPKLDTSLTISPLAKMSNSMTLEWHLTQLGNRDIEKALEAVQHIDTILSSDQQRHHLHQHEDFLVAQLVRQLEFLNQSNHHEVVNCYKKNFGLLLKFFGNHPELSCNVKEATLREAVKTLILLLTEKRLEMIEPNTDMFVRVVNNVVIRVLDMSDHTAIVCALVKNLYDTVNNQALGIHYQDLLMKCIWKVIKFLGNWQEHLDYVAIFTDIHSFLRDYPSSWWKKQQSDTPLRTIKTIMHTIVKLNGPKVFDDVKRVRGVTPESELWTYVQRLLKHIRIADPAANIPDNNPEYRETPTKHKRMSKSTHDQLSEIFTKIGNEKETKEGLQLLYEFKLQCPDADVNPFLQRSSQFFQDYISRGLKSIEAERRMAGQPGWEADNKVDRDSEDRETGQYLQKLRAWQVKAGWDNTPAAVTRPTPLSPPQQPVEHEPLPVRHSQLNLSGDSGRTGETDVEALRKRLEMVKSSTLHR